MVDDRISSVAHPSASISDKSRLTKMAESAGELAKEGKKDAVSKVEKQIDQLV